MSMTLFSRSCEAQSEYAQGGLPANRPRQRSTNRANFLDNMLASTQVVATVHPTRVEAKSLPENWAQLRAHVLAPWAWVSGCVQSTGFLCQLHAVIIPSVPVGLQLGRDKK